MAIITPQFRRLMAETFIEKLTDDTFTKNIYFFFGRSKPWTDPDANVGVGTITLETSGTTLTIIDGNFAGIPESSTIKNLDSGEVRKIGAASSGPLYDSLIVNAPAGIRWSTNNWAWKAPEQGSVWKDDNNPPTPNGSQFNQCDSALTMLALKRINQSLLNDNVSYVIKRFDWDSLGQTVYAMYRDNDEDLFAHPTQSDIEARDRWNAANPTNTYEAGSHWVLVNEGSNYYVFKCLDNGINASGIPNKSTVQPSRSECTDTNDYTQTCSDGYKWKFLYTISADQVLKFLTDSWVPVRQAVNPTEDPSAQNQEQWYVQQNAKPGAIDVIRLTRCDNALTTTQYLGDTVDDTTLLPDQTGRPLTEVQLPTGLAASDIDAYLGCDIWIYDSEELRRITAYDNVNKIITVDTAFTTAPAENNAFCIAPAVTITGVFEEISTSVATARCVLNGTNYIEKILVLTKGLYYRSAQVKISSGIDAAERLVAFAEPEVSPIEGIASTGISGGHGYNAIKELGGFDLMFYTQLKNIEGQPNDNSPYPDTYDFMQSNEYRSIGMIRNVQKPNGDYVTTDDTLIAVKTLIISTPSGNPDFMPDEIIEYSTGGSVLARAYVIEYVRDSLDPLVGTLTYFQNFQTGFEPFASSGQIYGSSSAAIATITAVETAEINTFSGEMLYLEQRKPIVRAPEQIEDVKLVVEF